MGCRLPGASSLESFWELIEASKSAIRDLPEGRWEDGAVPSPYGLRGGYLENVTDFDWRTLRMLPREVRYMDPQHRLLLELAWEALEDAGVPFEKIAGSNTGVFMGLQWNDYYRLVSEEAENIKAYTVVGNDFSFAANRISYAFDLRGPSQVVNAACASGLVALQQACQSLWLGDSDSALVGAAELMLSPDSTTTIARTGMMSKSGKTRSFDSRGDGFVRGEGAGVVVLKRVSDVTNRDRVYALVRGTAVRHNGKNEWIMAPNARGQQSSFLQACERAGVTGDKVQYVEMHATGKARSDELETQSLYDAVVSEKRSEPCHIGSAKPNLGHLGPASGMAALIKTALAIHRCVIPPTKPEEENETLPLGDKMILPKEPVPWKNNERVAGVTSMSLGGTNANAVLTSYGKPRIETMKSKEDLVLPVSARSEYALRTLCTQLADFITENTEKVRDICFTSSVGRSQHEYRAVFVGKHASDLTASLRRGESSANLPPVAQQFLEGKEVDWSVVYQGQDVRTTSIPTYPWQRERVWPKWLSAAPVENKTSAAEASRPKRAMGTQNEEMQAGVVAPTELLGPLAQGVVDRPERERIPHLRSEIAIRVASLLGLSHASLVDERAPLMAMGLDSMMAVELRDSLADAMAKKLPSTLLFDYPTVDRLAEHLLSLTVKKTKPAPKKRERQTTQMDMDAASLSLVDPSIQSENNLNPDEMSEEELSDFLAQELEKWTERHE